MALLLCWSLRFEDEIAARANCEAELAGMNFSRHEDYSAQLEKDVA